MMPAYRPPFNTDTFALIPKKRLTKEKKTKLRSFLLSAFEEINMP